MNRLCAAICRSMSSHVRARGLSDRIFCDSMVHAGSDPAVVNERTRSRQNAPERHIVESPDSIRQGRRQVVGVSRQEQAATTQSLARLDGWSL